MPSVHITSQGEQLDLICMRHYGRQFGVVEKVLEANPDIKNVAHRLPLGLEVILPDLGVDNGANQLLRLWD